jgi:hypothetical protein
VLDGEDVDAMVAVVDPVDHPIVAASSARRRTDGRMT